MYNMMIRPHSIRLLHRSDFSRGFAAPSDCSIIHPWTRGRRRRRRRRWLPSARLRVIPLTQPNPTQSQPARPHTHEFFEINPTRISLWHVTREDSSTHQLGGASGVRRRRSVRSELGSCSRTYDHSTATCTRLLIDKYVQYIDGSQQIYRQAVVVVAVAVVVVVVAQAPWCANSYLRYRQSSGASYILLYSSVIKKGQAGSAQVGALLQHAALWMGVLASLLLPFLQLPSFFPRLLFPIRYYSTLILCTAVHYDWLSWNASHSIGQVASEVEPFHLSIPLQIVWHCRHASMQLGIYSFVCFESCSWCSVAAFALQLWWLSYCRVQHVCLLFCENR